MCLAIKQKSFLNNPWNKEEIRGFRKYFKLNDNENVPHQKSWAPANNAQQCTALTMFPIKVEKTKIHTSSQEGRRVKQRMQKEESNKNQKSGEQKTKLRAPFKKKKMKLNKSNKAKSLFFKKF